MKTIRKFWWSGSIIFVAQKDKQNQQWSVLYNWNQPKQKKERERGGGGREIKKNTDASSSDLTELKATVTYQPTPPGGFKEQKGDWWIQDDEIFDEAGNQDLHKVLEAFAEVEIELSV